MRTSMKTKSHTMQILRKCAKDNLADIVGLLVLAVVIAIVGTVAPLFYRMLVDTAIPNIIIPK